jgi:phospholipid N-methyltransferase
VDRTGSIAPAWRAPVTPFVACRSIPGAPSLEFGQPFCKQTQLCEVLAKEGAEQDDVSTMANYELSQERRLTRWKRKAQEILGPWGVFLRGFLEEPRMVGSIIPSSRFTVRKMLEPVDWHECRLFVEYGPGVGTFCGPVLDRLRRDGTLIVIDTNRLYIDYLRRTIRDSRFIAVHGSAEDVVEIIRAHGHEHADYVLSGLPFSTLPDGVGERIAKATHRALRPGGAFLTYQFSKDARNLTAHYFDRVDDGFEMLNILPCRLAWGWKEAV